MDRQAFRDFAKNRILQATIEVGGKTYPNIPVKFPPHCCLILDDEGVTIHNIVPLTNKKGEKIDVISFTEIEKIEVNPVQKLTVVVIAIGTRFNLDLKIFLKDGTSLHFECEAMVMLPQFSSLVSKHHVSLKDPFDLVKIFEKSTSDRAAYDYLEENIEKIAEQRNIKLLKLTQMED